MTLLRRFLASETGSTAIEYSTIAALVAVGCYSAFHAVGLSISDVFEAGVRAKVDAAISP